MQCVSQPIYMFFFLCLLVSCNVVMYPRAWDVVVLRIALLLCLLVFEIVGAEPLRSLCQAGGAKRVPTGSPL